MRGVAALALATVALLATVVPGPAATADRPARGAPCDPGAAPFDLPGTDLVPEVNLSKDDDPVGYVFWRGTVPSFDGMPLSVDVTVPCSAGDVPTPTVVMAHGFTDDKTIWEETGKSDTVHSTDRPGSNDRWNNIWFASQGAVVLNYTARGWRDSCGPDTPGHTVDSPAPQCAPHEYWIHLDDTRWEARDAQWLVGGLVQAGRADPDRLAITGGSYGGAPTLVNALLADRTMCGADPVPAELGPDPCAGAADGELVPWTTPDGDTPLQWAAAVPMYTYGDLMQVLAPNGRSSDGWDQAPPPGDPVDPVGVPLAGTVSGLLAAAGIFGSTAPPGADPQSDIVASAQRLLDGDPFPTDDPEVAASIALYRTYKSAVGVEPQGTVPILLVQGMTDALFPATEALATVNRLKAADPDYPVQLVLGDLGHDYAAERQDDWDMAKERMHAFVDHHLWPERTPDVPGPDVLVAVTRCLDPEAPFQQLRADDWHDLHPDHVTLTSRDEQHTSTTEPGPSGAATDPISGATLPGPDSYKGCRTVRPAATDPTAATYEFPVTDDLLVAGGPVVALTVTAGSGGIPLAVRVWDVAGDGSAQGLVARGAYRVDPGAAPDRSEVRFQLPPQAYRFPAGHRIRVEVTGNDSPYLQASSVAADVTVHDLALTLPLADDAPDVAPAPPTPPTDEPDAGGSSALWWVAVGLTVAGCAVAGLVALARRRRPPPDAIP